MPRFLFWTMLVALAAALWLVWVVLRRAIVRRSAARASGEFARQRAACQEAFLTAAAASGKPRGLAWKRCDLHGRLVLARDRASGELIGLVGATISFEAVAGGSMEEVEAVGNLRAATAVFIWDGREWTTQGRAVFNLEPDEVLDRYRDSLEPVTAAEVD